MPNSMTRYYTKRICENCENEFDAYIYNVKKGLGKYCSRACRNVGAKLGYKKGHPSYWTDETRAKVSASLKGHNTSPETRQKISLANTGKKVSEETRAKLSKIHVARWDKIGRKTDGQDRRKDYKYLAWRRKVLKRDNWVCVLCGTTKDIQADHIKEWGNYPQLRYRVSNGRTLCVQCHRKTPNYGMKAYGKPKKAMAELA